MREYLRYSLALLFLIFGGTLSAQTWVCQADFSYTQTGNTVTFTDNSTTSAPILNWFWDFGDGSNSTAANATHTYAQAGIYGPCLSIFTADSCYTIHCDTVVVQGGGGSSCQAAFTVTPLSASGFQLTNASTATAAITSYLWDFGDGSYSNLANPNHAYTSAGTYSICLSLTTADNCTSTYCDSVVASTGCGTCHAEFTVSQNGPIVNFTDVSVASSTIAGWYWDYGDGSFSYGQNPSHSYAVAGYYAVCLSIITLDSCTSTWCDTIYTQCSNTPTCQANFTATPDSNLNGSFQFNDQSTASGPIVSWSWSFGDGSTSTQQNPNHVYAQSGSYLTCLTIFTADSCSSTFCDTVTVNIPCNCGPANFSYSVSGNTVTFTNTSQGCYSYSGWTFGNGSTSSQTNPVYTYSGPGTYPVCLCIYDANNNLCDIICQNVQIGSGCNINAAFTYQVSGNTVYFQNQSTGNIAYYDWIFGNFQTSTQVNPSHTFPGPGSYNVCLLAWDSSFACADTLCQTITIVGCQANAAFTYTVSGNTVSFNNQSSGAPLYQWWFGTPNGSSTAANPVYTYPGPGTYSVCLTAYDSNWVCYDSVCTTVTVGSSPCSANAAFTWTRSGNTVNFQHSGPSGPYFFLWYFGDGGSSTQQNPQHTYPGPGTFPITLYVYDSLQNCADTLFTSLTIPAGPRTPGGAVNLMWNIVNFPNPTTGISNLRYELSEETEVTIQVFGLDGRVIEVLVEGETQQAGEHAVKFDATDLPGGIYLYDIRAGDSREGLRFVKE